MAHVSNTPNILALTLLVNIFTRSPLSLERVARASASFNSLCAHHDTYVPPSFLVVYVDDEWLDSQARRSISTG